MTAPQWRQKTITFADPDNAEQTAIAHLAPILTEAETHSLISSWFYVRKGEWRLRYLAAADSTAAERYVTNELGRLVQCRLIHDAVAGIYEPEIHAFGGTDAMNIAHQLWHRDSHHLLTSSTDRIAPQRELSVMLSASMMRTAGLDWYEQGDVWARVAEHRDPPDPAFVASLYSSANRLLMVDPASLTHQGATMADCHTLFEAYATAGSNLRYLNQTGQLHRGLREILAHHVIFAWNRRSIPGPHQAAIATAAKTLIFGPDPTISAHTPGGQT